MANKDRNKRSARKARAEERARVEAAQAASAPASDPTGPSTRTKNMEIKAISVGNRPLQGTRALVRIAIRRSRGLWMMRQPITPTALQPSPMHMQSACLPQARQR